MNKRYALIFNPVAGKNKAAGLLPLIEEQFRVAALTYDIMTTQAVGHAEELAHNAAHQGYDVVIAAGGDGTCNEVINGLMKYRSEGHVNLPALGILPVGRGNDFAYGAGIPAKLNAACQILASGHQDPLDVGLIKGGFFPQGRYFGNGIGIGFDTIVGLKAAEKKHLHSALTYASGAIDTLIAYPKAPDISITFNGRTMDIASQQISILNGRRMGGLFHMAPFSRRHDGLLDLCMVVRPMTRRDMIRLILHYIKGTQRRSPLILTEKAPGFRIVAPKGGLVCHADGETICTDGTELTVECLPAALRICCDPALPGPLASAGEPPVDS